MNHWNRAQLGTYFSVEKGKVGVQAAISGDYKLITTGEKFGSHIEYHFEGEAICIPLVSSTGHGHASLKRIHYVNGKFAVGNILAACINKNPDQVSGRFVFYFLTANKDRLIVPMMKGSANVSLKIDDLYDIEILHPPGLNEQQTIVTRLDAVAEKVRQVETKLDEIEADADALIISLHHELSAARTVRLGDILELSEIKAPVLPDVEYPQVGLRGFGGGLFAKPALRMTDTTYKTFNHLYLDAIVLSQVKGWEGALAVCTEPFVGMYASPEYRTFSCLPHKASPAYLGELIRTPWFWNLLQNATRGAGARRERTRPEQFLEIVLPMPTFENQVKATQIVSRLKATKSQHTETRLTLKALLPSMLEQIFTPSAK